MKATNHRSSSIAQLARVVFIRPRRRKPRLACMQRTLPKGALLVACLATLAVGCGDDGGGGGASAGRYTPLASAARSDGSPGGDLTALQYRLSETQCRCAGDLAEFCIQAIWGEDGVECARTAYNEHIASDGAGIACLEEAFKAAIDCFQRASCDDISSSEPCFAAYEADIEACPPPSHELADKALACFGLEDWDI